MANSDDPRRRDTGARLAFAALLALVLLGLGYLACHPRDLWVRHYRGADPALGIGLAVHALLAVALAGRGPRWLCWVVLAASAFLLGGAITVQPLGDHGLWPGLARHDGVAASSLLASWLVWLAFAVHPTCADLLAPSLGAAFMLAWGAASEALLRGRRTAADVRVCALVPICTGWPILFARGYFEVTQLGMVFTALACGALLRGGAPRACAERSTRAAAWASLAALSHGQGLTTVAAVLADAACAPAPSWRARLGRLGRIGAVLGLTTLGAVALVAACGLEITAGHLDGFLVPIVRPPDAPDHLLGMFQRAHLAEYANVLLGGAPLAVVLLLPAWALLRRAGADALPMPSGLVFAAAAGAAFAFAVQFDLGFPGDYDLMMTGSVSLNLLIAWSIVCCRPPALLRWPLLAAAAAHAFVLMSSLAVAPAPATGAAVLTVNGRMGEVRLRPGERVWMEVRRPLGRQTAARFAVVGYRGLPPGGERPDPPGTEPALGFPLDSRSFVLTTNFRGQPETGIPSWPAPWFGELPKYDEPLTFQGLIEDAGRVLRATNAVVVVPSARERQRRR